MALPIWAPGRAPCRCRRRTSGGKPRRNWGKGSGNLLPPPPFEWCRNEVKKKNQSRRSAPSPFERERPPKRNRALRKGCRGIAPPGRERGCRRGTATHPRPSRGIAPRVLHAYGAVAARADRASPAASVHPGFYRFAVHGFYRVARGPWLCRRRTDHHGIGKVSWAARGHHRPSKGAGHEAAAGPKFRAAQTRGLPERATHYATRCEFWTSDFHAYRYSRSEDWNRLG